MAMPTVFKSSDEFNEFTYAVSQQMASMKLSTLREAIAQAAGFRHLDAYRAHLDKHHFTEVTIKKPSNLSGVAAAILPNEQDTQVSGVAIYMEAGFLVFQGAVKPALTESLDRDRHSNEDVISTFLVGKRGLEGVVVRTDDKGQRWVNGCLDFNEPSAADVQFAYEAVQHFRKTQGSDWVGSRLFISLYNQLMLTMIENPDWWSEYDMLKHAKDYRNGVPIMTMQRMMGGQALIPYEAKWLEWVPASISPDELRAMSNVYHEKGNELHTSILNLRVEDMVLTALSYLSLEKVDVNRVDAVTECVESSGKALLDAMALSFFAQMPVNAAALDL